MAAFVSCGGDLGAGFCVKAPGVFVLRRFSWQFGRKNIARNPRSKITDAHMIVDEIQERIPEKVQIFCHVEFYTLCTRKIDEIQERVREIWIFSRSS